MIYQYVGDHFNFIQNNTQIYSLWPVLTSITSVSIDACTSIMKVIVLNCLFYF